MIQDASGALEAALVCHDCESTLVMEAGRVAKVVENEEPPVIDSDVDDEKVREAISVSRGMISGNRPVVLRPEEWAEIEKILVDVVGDPAM